MTTQTLHVKPTSRGVRIWLEGKRLHDAGFVRHARYFRESNQDSITYYLHPEGSFKVAGRSRNGKDIAIIDFSAKEIAGFEPNQELLATYTDGQIIITKAN